MQDPSEGLSVNKLTDARRIGQSIYEVDIARTPMVIKSFTEGRFSIHSEAAKVNKFNGYINKELQKAGK